MEPNNFIDNKAQALYNVGSKTANNDEHAEVIRMADRPPLNDPSCKHKLVIDPTDRIGNFVAWMCRCGLGKFVPDGLDPNTVL